MAFKLGKEHRRFAEPNKNRFNKDDASVPGTPIFRKDLEGGIMGEANIDGSIFISNKVTPGSEEERKILMHEMKHLVDMKIGKLSYTDDDITWVGESYPRKNGKIKFEGKWLKEGSKQFPWEKH